jgi:hypothetical protein
MSAFTHDIIANTTTFHCHNHNCTSLLLLLPLLLLLVVVVVILVVLEMRIIQSSFDTFVRIPNGNGAPIQSKGKDYPSLALGTEEKLKETDKIQSAFGSKRVNCISL